MNGIMYYFFNCDVGAYFRLDGVSLRCCIVRVLRLTRHFLVDLGMARRHVLSCETERHTACHSGF
jgi:hypothetical protein